MLIDQVSGSPYEYRAFNQLGGGCLGRHQALGPGGPRRRHPGGIAIIPVQGGRLRLA
jgi:hypothetical protein